MKREEAVAGRFIQDGCGTRVYICGHNVEGIPVGQLCDRQPSTLSYVEWDRWELLPAECKSFNWKPETFPQWYDHQQKGTRRQDVAYIRRESKTDYVCVLDGNREERRYGDWHLVQGYVDNGTWKKITEAEALALLDKPEPVESPDDWVTQDRVPARAEIDEERWSDWKPGNWITVEQCFTSCGMMHGDFRPTSDKIRGASLEVRCRRKDLPPLPEPEPAKPATRKETIPKWRVEYVDGVVAVITCTKPSMMANVIYKSVQQVGFEEIEVPL